MNLWEECGRVWKSELYGLLQWTVMLIKDNTGKYVETWLSRFLRRGRALSGIGASHLCEYFDQLSRFILPVCLELQ